MTALSKINQLVREKGTQWSFTTCMTHEICSFYSNNQIESILSSSKTDECPRRFAFNHSAPKKSKLNQSKGSYATENISVIFSIFRTRGLSHRNDNANDKALGLLFLYSFNPGKVWSKPRFCFAITSHTSKFLVIIN